MNTMQCLRATHAVRPTGKRTLFEWTKDIKWLRSIGRRDQDAQKSADGEGSPKAEKTTTLESGSKLQLVGGQPGRGKLDPGVWRLQPWNEGPKLTDGEGVKLAVREAAEACGLPTASSTVISSEEEKLALYRLCFQKTKRRIPDPVLASISTVGDIVTFYNKPTRKQSILLDPADFIDTNVTIRS